MHAEKSIRTAVVVALFIGGVLAISGRPVSAAPVPIYNAPPGGGPVTPVVEKAGPYHLDAMGGLNADAVGDGLVPRPDGAFGLKSATFDLVDENDQPIGHHDVHLHHFVIATVGEKDVACPNRKVLGFDVKPLVGSGMERTPIAFADPYALLVGKDDVWGATWHLMNMTNTPRTVYVKYTIGVQPGADAQNSRPLVPFWADARTCPAGAVWNVPGNGGPGAIETKTKEWTMPFDGYIAGIGGHMHDGGISITTKHEDGTLICENLASYYLGMLDKISSCVIHDSIKAGEKISVSSRYDNSAPHDEVMGISVIYLWSGDQGTPPSTTGAPSSTSTTAGANVSPASQSNINSATASPVVAVPRFAG